MIRELTIDDLEHRSFKETFPQYLKYISQNNPFIHYIGYIEDNKIVGILIYTIMYDRAEIEQIEVIKEKRHQNIASMMIEYLISKCIDEQVKNITLEVRSDNIPAIKLYQKYGFHNCAIRKNYYHGTDGILMEKEVIK